MKLVELEGSQKQIEWAETIRARMVDRLISDPRFNGKEGLGAVLKADHSPSVAGYYLKRILLETSARWWIDHRNATGILGILKSEMKKATDK